MVCVIKTRSRQIRPQVNQKMKVKVKAQEIQEIQNAQLRNAKNVDQGKVIGVKNASQVSSSVRVDVSQVVKRKSSIAGIVSQATIRNARSVGRITKFRMELVFQLLLVDRLKKSSYQQYFKLNKNVFS